MNNALFLKYLLSDHHALCASTRIPCKPSQSPFLIFRVCRSSHTFYLDLIRHFSFESSFVVSRVFIYIVIAAIRRLGSGEWDGYEQGGEQEGLYNEGMPSHHIYLPVCKYACFIVLQMIYLIPVASVLTDTPTLILCRFLLDTLSRL